MKRRQLKKVQPVKLFQRSTGRFILKTGSATENDQSYGIEFRTAFAGLSKARSDYRSRRREWRRAGLDFRERQAGSCADFRTEHYEKFRVILDELDALNESLVYK